MSLFIIPTILPLFIVVQGVTAQTNTVPASPQGATAQKNNVRDTCIRDALMLAQPGSSKYTELLETVPN